MFFKWSIANGGYLKYIDRERKREIRVSLDGKTLSRSYTFQWDLIKPYHACAISNRCSDPPVKTEDVTQKVLKKCNIHIICIFIPETAIEVHI